ncbi:polysaccharide biosynthesis protein [Alkaliphilus peptidifermentans]|uniref:Predicted amino acid dehydrogenase n=1 Tax=Alkaliphilus peptidifermentans DSM 18978 TaxID=1120976 RepID=A0A1G5KRF8_9FIRM|nr:polysaccharide biosynthesis protein [Alkaliphilus peptidifermentans]SCZ02761.1 Predicted amino acid dehydrogenase [Alkaliphilus peptidifermentans DSM 18978]
MDKFAFIIHPIELNDIYRKYKSLKFLPDKFVEKLVTKIKPSIVSEITNIKGNSSVAEGMFIGLPLTSKLIMELPEEKVIKKIIEAGKIAERTGAKILGLGAFTSVVGDAGITVAKNLDISVTTGNTYTVAAAFDATREALKLLGKKLEDCHVAIVGATGSVGKVCAELTCREASKITLVARDPVKLKEVQDGLNKKYQNKSIEITISVEDGIKDADAVITVTSSTSDIVRPEFIKTGAVVCDVARPRDVSKDVQEKRRDVLVIEGGVIEVPEGTNFNFNFGFPPGLSYACMAETMILALEGKYENYSLGREIEIKKVDEIRRLADKHGFRLAGLRSFERVIDEEYIQSVMAATENRGYLSQN